MAFIECDLDIRHVRIYHGHSWKYVVRTRIHITLACIRIRIQTDQLFSHAILKELIARVHACVRARTFLDRSLILHSVTYDSRSRSIMHIQYSYIGVS